MLVENEQCNGVDDFLVSVWDRRKEIYVAINQHAQPYRTMPLQSVWSMAPSAMTVE